MTHATTQHRGAWYANAIDGELSKLRDLAAGNVCKPSHPFAISIFKIASITKGGNVSQLESLNAIKKTCAVHNWLSQKDIDYQWKRAYKNAKPRHPKEQTSLPTVTANLPDEKTAVHQKTWHVVELNLTTEKQKIIRTYDPFTTQKAYELADKIKDYLTHGVLIDGLKTSVIDTHPNGKITLRIQTQKYSQKMHDCASISATILGGSLWSFSAKIGGIYDLLLPPVPRPQDMGKSADIE